MATGLELCTLIVFAFESSQHPYVSQDAVESSIYRNWEAPLIEQYIVDGDEPESHYPTYNRRFPDHFHYSLRMSLSWGR